MNTTAMRSRWAAVGAAVAITLGAGGIGFVSATSPSDAVAYVPVEPCRIIDTRAGEFNVGPKSTPLGANSTFTVDAHGDNGECTGIPNTATGLQLNVTALGATAATFLTIWGDGDQPNASALNPSPGQPPVPNAVTTGLTGAGQFTIYNLDGNVDVLADVVGYYTDHNHDDQYAAKGDTYTKGEVDAAVSPKANSADVYTKAEADSRFDNADADVDGTDEDNSVSGTDEILATVTVDTPTSGYVVANSSATLYANGQSSAARCSITTGSAIDTAALQEAYANTSIIRTSMAGTRGFTINKAFLFSPDELTINLVCDGIGGNPSLRDPQLTAVFVPDPDAFGLIVIGP